MKSVVLFSSNLPNVIDRSNLSPSREARFSFFISILMMTQGIQETDDITDFRNADSRNKPVRTG